MSKDRPVATDALETLGTAPIPDNAGRDAIHLAVEPAVADCQLSAGEWVGRKSNGRYGAEYRENSLGIVDPFLTGRIQAGDRFWLIIPPRQITSLRHVWAHPDFPEAPAASYHAEADDHYVSPSKAASEQWIREYCESERCEVGFHDLMSKATDFCNGHTGWSDEYLHFDGTDAHGDIDPEFWRHFEIVTGLKPRGEAPAYFSCSC